MLGNMNIPSIAAPQPGGDIVQNLGAQNALSDAMLKTRMQQLQNQFYAPKVQAEINYQNSLTSRAPFENALNQVQTQTAQAGLPYVAGQAQADIGYKNALASGIPSENRLRDIQAQTASAGLPYVAGQAQATIDETKARAGYYQMGGAQQGANQKDINALQRQVMLDNPGIDPMKANQIAGSYVSGNSTLPDGSPVPPPSGVAQTLVDGLVKRTNTAQGLNQQRYAKTLDAYFTEADKYMPEISKYAGIIGKASGNVDKIKASLGDTEGTKTYGDWIYMTRQVMPGLASELGRALGAAATDQQKQMMSIAANPITADSNPEIALKNYTQLKNMYKTLISPAISQGVGQTRADLRNSGQGTAPQGLPPAQQLNAALNTTPPTSNLPTLPLPGQMMQMQSPDGRHFNVPAANVPAAMKRGLTRIG